MKKKRLIFLFFIFIVFIMFSYFGYIFERWYISDWSIIDLKGNPEDRQMLRVNNKIYLKLKEYRETGDSIEVVSPYKLWNYIIDFWRFKIYKIECRVESCDLKLPDGSVAVCNCAFRHCRFKEVF